MDDFLHAGDKYFNEVVMTKLRSSFEVGKVGQREFRYTGLNIKTHPDGVEINQNHYVSAINLVKIDDKSKQREVSKEENTLFRAAVGSVNWACQQTRPDASFEVLELSMRLRDTKVEDIMRVNKCIKKLQHEEVAIFFRKFSSEPRIVAWSDAAFANLQDGVSSGCGYLILLADDEGNCCPLAWKSNKVKRVVKSTVAAEALAYDETIGHSEYLQSILEEMTGRKLQILAVTDSKNLLDSLSYTRQVDDRRLRIDIAAIKQTIQEKNIRAYHVPGDMMLADCLTKKGVSTRNILDVVSQGKVPGHLKFW